MLNIALLGQFSLRKGDKPVELSSRPAQTLLAYLLLNRTVTHRRGRLAGLLWPDYPESSARQSLRNALWQLRQAIGESYLLADKASLAFNTAAPHTLDVAILESGTDIDDPDALMQVVSVYEGDLLPGLYEDWVLLARERLRALFEQLVQRLLEELEIAERWREVQNLAERWIALGHVPEPAFQALMKAHSALGDRAGMANSYRRCRQALEDELGVTPSPETEALFKRLSAEDEAPALLSKTSPKVVIIQDDLLSYASLSQKALPTYTTPFIGRQEELEEIGRLINQEPDCRLLTLVGPGGIGKTRLAIEAARTAAFAHGAWFVPLTSLGSGVSLVAAIADVLNLSLDSSADACEQLIAYLRQRELLLVLDNFEHLLSPMSIQAEANGQDVVAVLARLLEHTPRVKLLVTSRERLSLSAEWVFNVGGLRIPEQFEEENGHDAADFSAIQLFVQRGRQLNRSFGQDVGELACAAQICRLVGGMPLAIELAAAWVNVLNCGDILQEIERNLSFLQTSLRDYPERHRNMHAVFDTSWKMLAEPERRLFRRLSVFRGGFTRAAAEAVGGEMAWTEDDLSLNSGGTEQLDQRQPQVLGALTGLVDKSFVRSMPGGRYEIHELMRQFGAVKLIEQPEEERQTRDNHARYYLVFLMHHEASLKGPRQREVLEMVAAEMENVNAAWKWAVAQEMLAVINEALSSYFNFCLTRSRLHEGEEAFAHLVDTLQRAGYLRERPLYNVLLARAIIRRAGLCYVLGRYDDAQRYAEAGLAFGLEAPYRRDVAFAQIVLGVVAGWRGDRELAEKWLKKSLSISHEIDDQEIMADALHELAQLYGSFGDYHKAKQLGEQSLAVSRAYGRPDWIAQALVILGWAVVCLGEYTEAEACYREALAIFESLGNRHGAADALDGLGWVAWCQENFEEADNYYEQSLAVMRELGHRRVLANTLCDLAILANEQGDFERAETISHEGLRLADELDSAVYKVPYLCCLGSSACGSGDFEESGRYLRQSLQLAYDTGLWPPLTFILYEFAGLLLAESEATDLPDEVSLQRKRRVLELLAFVRHNVTTWAAIRKRAARLQARLEGALPEDVVPTAVARGKDSTLDEVVKGLLEPM